MKLLAGAGGVIGSNSAASTFEYGYAGTLNSPGPIPAVGPTGLSGSGRAALGISAAWSGAVTYTQSVTLPAGRYTIQYTATNTGPNASSLSRVGWVPTTGTSVISTRTSFPLNTWITGAVTFTLAAETTGVIQVGIASNNVGSGSVGRIFFDNIQLLLHDLDKTALGQLITTATNMVNNPQPVGSSTAYADLSAAISTAQGVFDLAGATFAQVITQENALTAAIAAVNSAILIHQRTLAWTTLPFNITSLIVNPSFEAGNANGWVNVGGFVSQSNTSLPQKHGTFYVERWMGSGNWTGLRLSQRLVDLPNGIYQVSAVALNNPATTGGAFVFGNNERVEVLASNDYSVLVRVTNNQLEIGYEVVLGGNWVAVDNFRVSYISDGSPYMVASPESLFFDPINLNRTFNVTGGNLTENVTLSAPAGITLDKTTLTPAQVASGVAVTATFDNATAIASGNIVLSTGSLAVNVAVITSADLACFTPIYHDAVNLIPNPYLNSIASFGGWGRRSVVFGAEAFCGAAAVKFDALTNSWPDGAALDVTGIAWEPNATYRVRAMVKAVDGTFAFFANQTNPNVTIPIAQSGDNWVMIDETFTVGPTPGTSFFSFNNVDGGSTGRIAYIDNWELYKVPVGVSVPENHVASPYRIFVNNGQIAVRFSLDQAADVEVSVYNMKGMLLTSQKAKYNAGNNFTTIEANMAAGVYVVKIRFNGQTYTAKVLK